MLRWTTLAVQTRTVGPDDEGTLATEGILVNVVTSGRVRRSRVTWSSVAREDATRPRSRPLRDAHASANLAASLSQQGKHAEAAEIEREVLVSTTRLLGAEHEETLRLATNLAFSLSQCGQKTEGEQLLHDTLALSRCAIDPAHNHTQNVLQAPRAAPSCARSHSNPVSTRDWCPPLHHLTDSRSPPPPRA